MDPRGQVRVCPPSSRINGCPVEQEMEVRKPSLHTVLQSILLSPHLYRFPCERSLYPFHDGKFEDFEPIFQSLISKNINSGYTDEYTREFVPTAERLEKEADKIADSSPKEASDLYLRACTVYRIARFPYINSPYKKEVYDAQNKVYLKAARYVFSLLLYIRRVAHGRQQPLGVSDQRCFNPSHRRHLCRRRLHPPLRPSTQRCIKVESLWCSTFDHRSRRPQARQHDPK